MNLSSSEISILYFLSKNKQIKTVERKSEKEFDLIFAGFDRELGCEFSAWLPLSYLAQHNWTFFADSSDYPEIVKSGDWSGIRDSSEESIWKMFQASRLTA